MEVLSPADFRFLGAGALGGAAYAAKLIADTYLRPTPKVPDLPLLRAAKKPRSSTVIPTRSILKQLDQCGKSCFIFYGSQTGTAERLAQKIARQALSEYNLECLVADLDDYDFIDLVKLSKQHLIIFVLATYGEGEPTDNAIALRNFMESDLALNKLDELRYSAFGLGSSSYTHYNAMIQYLDRNLSARDAQRIGLVGMGDDGKGTLGEDFSAWLDATLPLIASHFNLPRMTFVYKPAFQVTEAFSEEVYSRDTFLGEPNKAHLYGRVQGPFTSANPFPAKVENSRELFTASDRSCVHLEFDISNTSIRYDTGDHLAIWPVNSDQAVTLFLRTFSLSARRKHVVHVFASNPMTKLPVPPKTTIETLVRYYLDIGAAISRQDVRKLSEYATSDTLRTRLVELTQDRAYFNDQITAKQLTIAQLIFRSSTAAEVDSAINAPLSLILEIIPKLKPRHYSISSSSLVSRKSISITAVVNSNDDRNKGISFRGVSTNYLRALKAAHQHSTEPPTHTLKLQRQPDTLSPRPMIHVRRSQFRPPFDPSIPIIMVGPGTGIAPFRAFVQERAYQFSQGRKIGKTILFYGCRSLNQDFLYKEEWDDLLENEKLGAGVFEMYTAFSRTEGQSKQYVQDLIRSKSIAMNIRSLVMEQNARLYICGDASRMAKDVTRAIGDALVCDNGLEIVQSLKTEGRWFEDVW